MKNTQIKNLKDVVPKEIRLQVYKDALDYYHTPKKDRRNWAEGLCLLLPCILWDLCHYLDDSIVWDYDETSTAFPELEKHLSEIYKCKGDKARNKYRLSILTKWISDLEKY
jgi:hypothetical protein